MGNRKVKGVDYFTIAVDEHGCEHLWRRRVGKAAKVVAMCTPKDEELKVKVAAYMHAWRHGRKVAGHRTPPLARWFNKQGEPLTSWKCRLSPIFYNNGWVSYKAMPWGWDDLEYQAVYRAHMWKGDAKHRCGGLGLFSAILFDEDERRGKA